MRPTSRTSAGKSTAIWINLVLTGIVGLGLLGFYTLISAEGFFSRSSASFKGELRSPRHHKIVQGSGAAVVSTPPPRAAPSLNSAHKPASAAKLSSKPLVQDLQAPDETQPAQESEDAASRLVLITFANRFNTHVCDFLFTAVAAGWRRIEVVGYEDDRVRRALPQLQTQEFFMGKRALAAKRRILSSKESKDDVYVGSDSFDALVQRGPDVALSAFEAYGDADIVIATENDCWPSELADRYPPPPPSAVYQYLNNGGFVGRAEALTTWLSALMGDDIDGEKGFGDTT